MFAVSSRRAIDRWDVHENKLTRLCQFESAAAIQHLVVDDYGTCLFTSDNCGNIQRFNVDPESGAVTLAWQRSDKIDAPPRSCSLALSKDGKILASAYTRNHYSLALFDATSGELLARHTPQNWVSSDSFGIALSPQTSSSGFGRAAYTLGGDVIVVDWVVDDANEATIRFVDERLLKSESDTVPRVVFQNHSTLLATTTQNQLIKWDLNQRSTPELLRGQPRPLKILRPLPDGREVWTASGRNTIMTWCLHTSNSLVELPIIDVGPEGSISTIGREVTGYINGRKLFWQPVLMRWPKELDQPWPK
jgi:WD40 repeat protein